MIIFEIIAKALHFLKKIYGSCSRFFSIFQPIARGTCKYVPSCNAPKIKSLSTLHTLQKIDFKIIMILYLKFMIYEQLGSVGELVLYG